MTPATVVSKRCLVEPIPEILEAARLLDSAATAHLARDSATAERLLSEADMPVIRLWTESLWGQSHVVARTPAGLPPLLPKEQRVAARKPTVAQIRELHARDGFHCRLASTDPLAV